MDKQASGIYTSLTHLLDLKQKHANAFEARFARDLAALTAHQGQTILVFTIVTIIFLPMSFIAAFFAINFREWTESGTPQLSIGYVAKYMFGIGLGISVPLIVIALTVDDVGYFSRKAKAAVANLFSGNESSPVASLPAAAIEPPRISMEKPLRERSIDPLRKSFGYQERDFEASLGPPPVRVNSGNTARVSWARASYDRTRGVYSEDLESGRGMG